MAAVDQLKDAAEHLNAGRDAQAAAACAALLEGRADDPAALHLLGVALTRLGRAAEAMPSLERAAALSPASAPIHLAIGNALVATGRFAQARGAFERALALDPASSLARFRLAQALHESGHPAAAASHFARVARADPGDFEAMQRFVECVAATPPPEAPAAHETTRGPSLGPITVGLCTIRPERAARARASVERALGEADVLFDVVTDARSLSEAYNRILDRSRTERVILCHDDIEVVGRGLDRALARAFGQADLVGIVGAERVTGPAVLWAGHPYLHGQVAYPREAGFEAAPLSPRRGIVTGMQALDGVFLAIGPGARAHRFDERTFDGFHFYDLDFTYRAHLAGLRLAVTTDFMLVHDSEGRFGDEWAAYSRRFLDKFPALASAAAGPAHWYGARVADVAALESFTHELDRHIAELGAAP